MLMVTVKYLLSNFLEYTLIQHIHAPPPHQPHPPPVHALQSLPQPKKKEALCTTPPHDSHVSCQISARRCHQEATAVSCNTCPVVCAIAQAPIPRDSRGSQPALTHQFACASSNPHTTCRCSSFLTAANSTSRVAATAPPPPPPAPLLANDDENENLLPLPRRAASLAASLVAPSACAVRARLMARWGGVWSAIAISL